jgi:hypothetical protein
MKQTFQQRAAALLVQWDKLKPRALSILGDERLVAFDYALHDLALREPPRPLEAWAELDNLEKRLALVTRMCADDGVSRALAATEALTGLTVEGGDMLNNKVLTIQTVTKPLVTVLSHIKRSFTQINAVPGPALSEDQKKEVEELLIVVEDLNARISRVQGWGAE